MRASLECQTRSRVSQLYRVNGEFEHKKLTRKSPRTRVYSIIAVVILGGFVSWLLPVNSHADPGTPLPPLPAKKADSGGQAIRMTDVTAKVENGKISLSLDVVKEKKIVRFEYESNGVRVPLLSYVAPSGKVVTAVSVCEPCRSTKFHIRGNSIVCNACFAEWDIETLQGIRGGCLKYPPDVIPNKIEKGQILIDEKVVIQWKPRA